MKASRSARTQISPLNNVKRPAVSAWPVVSQYGWMPKYNCFQRFGRNRWSDHISTKHRSNRLHDYGNYTNVLMHAINNGHVKMRTRNRTDIFLIIHICAMLYMYMDACYTKFMLRGYDYVGFIRCSFRNNSGCWIIGYDWLSRNNTTY